MKDLFRRAITLLPRDLRFLRVRASSFPTAVEAAGPHFFHDGKQIPEQCSRRIMRQLLEGLWTGRLTTSLEDFWDQQLQELLQLLQATLAGLTTEEANRRSGIRIPS